VIPSLFGAGRGVYLPQGTYGFTTSGLQPMMPSAAYDSSSVGGAPAMGIASYEKGESLSARNVASIMPPHVNGSTGSSAEAFEVTSYSASYETAHLDDTCASISTLMAETFVVFESANAYERGCSFSFKVEKAHVDEVLAKLIITSDFGKAAVGGLLSASTEYFAGSRGLSEGHASTARELAKEFRVGAATTAGNLITSILVDQIKEVLTGAFAPKVRVVNENSADVEEEFAAQHNNHRRVAHG
jgi:hypothetical protein